MKSGIEEMCWKKMTVTGRTLARKKRKRAVGVGRRSTAAGASWSRRSRAAPWAGRSRAGEAPRRPARAAAAKRGRAVGQEEVPKRDRRQDAADRRADRHAEVDREAVHGEGRLAPAGLDRFAEEGHGRGPEGLGQHGEGDR